MAAIKYVNFIQELDTAEETDEELQTTLVYRVVFDLPGGMALAALNASGVDQNNNPVTIPGIDTDLVIGATATGLICNRRRSYREEDPTCFIVEVTFSSLATGTVSGRSSIAISSDAEETTVTTNRYSDGTLILNSARDLLTRPKPVYDRVYTVSWQVDAAHFDPNALDYIQGAINDADVTMTIEGVAYTFPKYTLLCVNTPWTITLQSATTTGGSSTANALFNVSARLKYRPTPAGATNVPFDTNPGIGWEESIADKGFRKLVSGVQTVITESDGTTPIADSVALDGSGGVLSTAGVFGSASERIAKGFLFESADFLAVLGGIHT